MMKLPLFESRQREMEENQDLKKRKKNKDKIPKTVCLHIKKAANV